MFCGLSAFPLTPMNETGVDEGAFVRLVERLAAAKVDSIGALGSAGSYAYLHRTERFRVAQLAVEHAGGIPVMTGIGALRTRDVLDLAEDAQKAGASAVLLTPVSYQKLVDDEVYQLRCASTTIPALRVLNSAINCTAGLPNFLGLGRSKFPACRLIQWQQNYEWNDCVL
jgi:dihydrodipicolinate synthase/N-acetylneuraminate lyase